MKLSERVERAEGPSRELDEAFALALGWSQVENPTKAMGLMGRWRDANGEMTDHFGVPRFTASLDAAMTLVPEGEGRWPQLEYISPNPNNPKQGHRARLWFAGGDRFRGESLHSFALALCAAALKARGL